MTLVKKFAALVPEAETRDAWRPRVFDPASREDWEALEALLASGRVRALHDTIDEQLAELAETRLPRPQDAPRRAALVESLAEGRPRDRIGRWVHYPWSGTVVHVLAEPAFRELRTSRNRYKITDAEQQRLRGLRLGIVGLSVGQATAVTLALEEVGGEYRLADFDRLSLSNMNRLRASTADVGANKAVLTARQIFELNPYARVRLFPQGIDDRNAEAFLTEGGALDLLFEECDDLYMKVFLRERARAHGIATLMETSDRGLLDVERFDREPARALFHGLVGDVRAETLRGLPMADKVPFVLDLLGTRSLSPRFAGSLFEIDRTIRTWPQLASGVALGGALNTEAARRIALGTFNDSGRFYVDLEEQLANGRGVATPPPPEPPRVEIPPAAPLALARVARVDDHEVREFVRAATLAPSGGNVQPWLFEAGRGRLLVSADPMRSGNVLDFERRATWLALGAAVENLRCAAATIGIEARVQPFPDASRPLLACEITFARGGDERGPTLEQLRRRVTNRRLAPWRPVTRAQADAIAKAAEESGVLAQLATEPAALEALATVLGEGDRLRFMSAHLHAEMQSEVRWTDADIVGTGDGLDVRSLELPPTDLAAMRLAISGAGLPLLRELGLGSALTEAALTTMRASSAALLVSIPGEGDRACFEGGRAAERIWIAAEAAGLAVQPYAALLYLLLRDERGEATMFSDEERKLFGQLRARLQRVFPRVSGRTPFLLARLAHAPPPTVRSLRRPMESVLRFVP